MELKLFLSGCIFFVIAMFMLAAERYFKIPLSQRCFKRIYSWVDTFWSALIIASLIMFFFIQAFRIPSGSMRNTLIEGDHLFVNKFIYGFHVPFSCSGKRFAALKNIKRGDIVVFQSPPEASEGYEKGEHKRIKKDYIKRCVAIAGDKVEIKNKVLFVNSIRVDDSYAIFNDSSVFQKTDLLNDVEKYQRVWEQGKFVSIPSTFIRDNFGPVIIPKGYYMMMGDNRDFSFDSRFWGPLLDKYVKGKALFLYWPIKRWRIL
ncbi:MAG: signal peptidase I [Endomicrobium sp.]|jgi:signal peptidase I|nr:signal peptidase I [Endomicrobium sp.]